MLRRLCHMSMFRSGIENDGIIGHLSFSHAMICTSSYPAITLQNHSKRLSATICLQGIVVQP